MIVSIDIGQFVVVESTESTTLSHGDWHQVSSEHVSTQTSNKHEVRSIALEKKNFPVYIGIDTRSVVEISLSLTEISFEQVSTRFELRKL